MYTFVRIYCVFDVVEFWVDDGKGDIVGFVLKEFLVCILVMKYRLSIFCV